jgi:hypothetical protein
MKVENFKLMSFGDQSKPFYSISVPVGSKLLKPVVLGDGIYLYFEVIELDVDFETLKFLIMGKDTNKVQGTFIDIVSAYIDDGQRQGTAVWPIYKLD